MPTTFWTPELLLTLAKTSPWAIIVLVLMRLIPQWIKSASGWIDRWGERLLTDRKGERDRFFQEQRDFETRCQGYSERIIGIVVQHQKEQMDSVLAEMKEIKGALKILYKER